MKKITGHIFGMIVLSILTATQAIAQIQVQAQVDRSHPIYVGSQFSYSIVVANGGQPDTVDLSPLSQFNPSEPSTQSRTSIINGRTSSYQILTYQLLAPGEGDYTIPSVTVTVDGKNYRTDPITISVVEPGTTQQIDIDMALSTQQCYVGQPVILTVSFYVWTDIVQAQQISDIGIQVPLLNRDDFYLEDIDPQTIRAKQTPFPINGRNENVFQDQVVHNGVNCVRIRFIKALIPKSPGTFQLHPTMASASLAVGQKQRSRDAFFDSFFGNQYEYKRFGAQSDPLELIAKALPQTDKPNDFYGLVGNYTISADATPKDVHVGDPITLTIRIGGSQYLKPVKWPDLDNIPEMAESFKIPSERSDGEIQDNAKVFTQTIRPSNENVTQIPAIPLSFFDANTGQYRTIKTKPIPLQVSPTRVVTGGDVESHQFSSAKKQLKAIAEGLAANYTSSDALINQQFAELGSMTSPAFIGLYAIPLIVLLLSAVIRYALADSPTRRAANKRKKAHSASVKKIRYAGSHEKPSQQVLVALKEYIADKFGKSAGALTAQDCGHVILEKTKDAALSHWYQEIMEQTEASEYSRMAFKLTDEKQKEILKLLATIEKKVK